MKCWFFRRKERGRFGTSKPIMRKRISIFIFFSIYYCQRKESFDEDSNIEHTIESTECESDFDLFFKEFTKDSIFQKNHIKFPLRASYYEDIASNVVVVDTIKTKYDYKYIDFTKDTTAMQNETGKYTTEKSKSKNKVVYKLLGYDNGIMVSYKFEIINSCWTMVEIVDEST